MLIYNIKMFKTLEFANVCKSDFKYSRIKISNGAVKLATQQK